MSARYVAVWPKVKVNVGEKRQVVERGEAIPDGVSDAELSNLVSFGAIAGVTVVEKAEKPAKEPKTPKGGKSGDDKPTSVKDILADVGDDKAKASEYLEAENAAEKPRPSLVEGLQAVIAAEA